MTMSHDVSTINIVLALSLLLTWMNRGPLTSALGVEVKGLGAASTMSSSLHSGSTSRGWTLPPSAQHYSRPQYNKKTFAQTVGLLRGSSSPLQCFEPTKIKTNYYYLTYSYIIVYLKCIITNYIIVKKKGHWPASEDISLPYQPYLNN